MSAILPLFNKSNNFFHFALILFFLNFTIFNFSFYETLYKLNVNGAFLTYLHFWWISFFCLYFFLSIIFFFFFFNSKILFFNYIPYFLFFYWVELQTTFIGNFAIFIFNTNYSLINFLLLNSLNKYHPFALYFAFLLLACAYLVYSTCSCFSRKVFASSYFLRFFFSQNWLVHVVLFSALVLGAWWAQQEGSWGGWWNWDPSENLGLIAWFFVVSAFHLRFINFFFFKGNFLIKNFIEVFFFLLVYLLLQLNFELVSHNFGLRFFFFFNSNLFFLELTFLFLLLIFFLTYALLSHKSHVVLLRSPVKSFSFLKCSRVYVLLLLSVVFAFYVNLTLNFLLSYFAWKFFLLPILNFAWLRAVPNLFFFFLLIFFLRKRALRPLWILPIVHAAHSPLCYLRIGNLPTSLKLHALLSLLLVVVFLSNNYPLIVYALTGNLRPFLFSGVFTDSLVSNLKLDGLFTRSLSPNLFSGTLLVDWRLTQIFLHQAISWLARVCSPELLDALFLFNPCFEIALPFRLIIENLYVTSFFLYVPLLGLLSALFLFSRNSRVVGCLRSRRR